jgi:hypothetical protein
MKAFPVLLVLSLAINVALLAVVGARSPLKSRPAPADTASLHRAQPPTPGEDNAVVRSSAVSGAGDAAAARADAWTSLSGGSLAEMVARLRAAGYPVAVIRALVSARISEEMRPRIRELMAGVKEPEYWASTRFGQDPKVTAAQREVYQEYLKAMKDVLGPDAIDDNEISQYRRRRQFGEIPAEKAMELQRIAADYADLKNEIHREANGVLMPEDRRQLEYLEKELHADYAKILTPEELERCELRSSSTSDMLRSQLAAFKPTEEEFRQMFYAAREIEAQFGSLQVPLSAEQNRQRQAAILEKAQSLLAPERYDAFKQATDPRYTTLNRIAARYDLPAAVVPEVYAVQQEIQQRARKVTAAERATQLPVLAQEAATRITPLLGERAFEAYKLYGGQWIENLTTPPANPRPQSTTATTPPTKG